MKLKDRPVVNVPDVQGPETLNPEVTEDHLSIMGWEIGVTASRVAVDPEISALLENQRELQGPQALCDTISGVGIAADWQGKHPNHPTADFFFSRELQNGKVLIVVGDLAGEGVTISYDDDTNTVVSSFDGGEFVCKLHGRLSSSPNLDTVNRPDDVIRLIDRIVTEEQPNAGESNMLKGKHFVLTALVIDPSTGTVEGSVHGTPPVYIREPNGDVQVINGSGTPIGWFPLDEIQVDSLSNLSPGTEIVVMTDGLTELPLAGMTDSYGITARVVDRLDADPSHLFNLDPDETSSLVHLVRRARENAVDDWGYVRITL